jgi:hypothetical protein
MVNCRMFGLNSIKDGIGEPSKEVALYSTLPHFPRVSYQGSNLLIIGSAIGLDIVY